MFSVSSRSDPDENNFADSLGFFLFFRPPLPPTGIEPESKKISFEIIAGGSFAKRCYLYLPLKSWFNFNTEIIVWGRDGQ